MPLQKPSRRHGPPYNPNVRELVAEKRRWSVPVPPEATRVGFQGWHERGYLPHRDAPGLVQFVTFRLADAFPAALRSEWAGQLAVTDGRERRRQFEAYLDRSRGEALLRRVEVGGLVDRALRFYHGEQFELRAWVVMPNHVHALVRVESMSLGRIIADLKRYTAREANRLLDRHGSFWAPDYWDTYVRDAEHERRVRRYIENNPTKAFLVRDPKEWRWSSARYRNRVGELVL